MCTPGAHGRREEELDVAAARAVDADDGLHVLQVVDLGVGAAAAGGGDVPAQGAVLRDQAAGEEGIWSQMKLWRCCGCRHRYMRLDKKNTMVPFFLRSPCNKQYVGKRLK